MSNTPLLSLPVAASVDGTEYAWIVQGGTDKRATLAQIGNTATGFVPTSRSVGAGTGLSGGGTLASDVTLNFAPSGLSAASTMAVTDSFVINSGSTPKIVTFPLAMQAIGDLSASPTLNLVSDKLIIQRAADGLIYYATPNDILVAAGNVPAGGTTGEALVKASNANYDTTWAALSLTVAGLSVVGNPTNVSGASSDITAGSDYQVLRRSGTTLGFGSIDISQSAVVGSSILAGANGGTGVANTGKTITLGGNLTTSGAFASTFTMTGVTGVTFPTSGTLATTGGANIPSIAQGDLLYGSATNVLSALAKDANATRYLSNTGSSNNPAWAQIALATGVSGQLPLANGGTNANLTASTGGIVYSGASALAILAGTATANQILVSGSSAAPAWSTSTYPATSAAGTILASLTANTITATATPTLGIAGSVVGSIAFANATSGSITVAPVAGALGSVTLTLPAATDTFAVLAASQALTNKTYNGLTITSSTGTLTVTNLKTLSISNTLTMAGTDSTTMTFPATSSNVLTTGNTATITKGYAVTPYSIGTYTSTQGTTLDPANGNYQYVSLSGSFTWTVTAPASDCAIDVLVILAGSGSGVTVAFSGFKTPGTGAAGLFTAANNTWYTLSVRRINSVSTYSWSGSWT
jgi:trimeric autotransporter adhesin